MAEDGRFSVMFRKGMIDSDPGLLKCSGIKELMNYVENKDANIERVKTLITKVNRELRLRGKQLYVRKSHIHDRYAENRICMTSR